ncbi:hypothetical protein OCU04_002242 [Sclerotinia nivalis]|uniref:Uncharacterized protein n=1 Tax=Sclerotinia nivalis TaxID=352851 RepID=A0A9X0B145_9HELO|nr:hypothetical protein OCU04_002242 [Sclerotinia nivalis]
MQNGLKYLGWDMRDVKCSLIKYEDGGLARVSKGVVTLLPWNHQIGDLVVYDVVSGFLGHSVDIIGLDAVSMIVDGWESVLDDSYFDTTGSMFYLASQLGCTIVVERSRAIESRN